MHIDGFALCLMRLSPLIAVRLATRKKMYGSRSQLRHSLDSLQQLMLTFL